MLSIGQSAVKCNLKQRFDENLTVLHFFGDTFEKILQCLFR